MRLGDRRETIRREHPRDTGCIARAHLVDAQDELDPGDVLLTRDGGEDPVLAAARPAALAQHRRQISSSGPPVRQVPHVRRRRLKRLQAARRMRSLSGPRRPSSKSGTASRLVIRTSPPWPISKIARRR